MTRGIEVGHIFQLGDKYSKDMNATVLDESGKARILMMGCYGIGVTRIVAAAIEQNYDDAGIVWPTTMAPFQVVLTPIGLKKSEEVRKATETLYHELLSANVEVLLDDRDERPGVMFNDAELIGIPHRVVLSEKTLTEGNVEYKARNGKTAEMIAQNKILEFLKQALS